MRDVTARIKLIGSILWNSQHMGYHALVGVVWSWFLMVQWGEYNSSWIILSVFGSFLPDIDHLFYFFLYGRGDTYSKKVRGFLRARKWQEMTKYIAKEHKNNYGLATHNYYVIGIFIGLGLLASLIGWKAGVVLFGAMALHYLFDITEDLILLGRINPNWKRWGKQNRM